MHNTVIVAPHTNRMLLATKCSPNDAYEQVIIICEQLTANDEAVSQPIKNMKNKSVDESYFWIKAVFQQ